MKALKGFFRWLRETKGSVTRGEDATLDLRVPQPKPEQNVRLKVVPPEDVAAVLIHLPSATRDVLHLLTATGWHLSEIGRFARTGEIARPMHGQGVLAVLVTRHKSGDLTKTPLLHAEHVSAAERIRARGDVPTRATFARHMREGCAKAGVPPFGMGQMRPSVLTWAVADGGASVNQASEFAQHRSTATTKRFYLRLAVPKNSVPVYQLLDGDQAQEPDADIDKKSG